jgi:hypothetical protein
MLVNLFTWVLWHGGLPLPREIEEQSFNEGFRELLIVVVVIWLNLS